MSPPPNRLAERLADAAAALTPGVLAIALAALFGPPPAASADPVPTPPPPLVLLTWDGAPDWAIDRLLAEGRMPHLAALAERGVAAEHLVSSFPSKTSAAFAALWTGCWADCNGIAGNHVPAGAPAEHRLDESASGYLAPALTAEPIYLTAALAGRRVVAVSATQAYPPGRWHRRLAEAGVEADRLLVINGFENRLAAGEVVGAEALRAPAGRWPLVPGGYGPEAREAVLEVADGTFYLLAYDDPGDPVRGLDTLLVRQGDRDPRRAAASASLSPRPAAAEPAGWSRPFTVGAAGTPGDPACEPAAGGPDAGASATGPEPAPAAAGDAADRGLGQDGGDSATGPAADAAPVRAPGAGASPEPAGCRLEGETYFRLFELAADGSRLVLVRRAVHALGGAPRQRVAAYRRSALGFHDDAFRLYDRGALGPPLPTGGDGTAERRVVELAAFSARRQAAGTRYLLAAERPEVLIEYSPLADEAGHTWGGVLDPSVPGHDRELAARLWPYYAAVLGELDAWLGEAVAAAPADAVLAVASDHGMAATRARLSVPRLLETAGLLVRDESGGIDLAASRVLPAGDGFLVRVNHRDWRGGIVADADRAAVVDEAARALTAARHPATGEPLVVGVVRPADRPDLGLGGERGGDLYLDPAPGIYPTARAFEGPPPGLVGPPRRPWGDGDHGYPPERRSMHAIFYAAGPGLARGRAIPAPRIIDLAPTLSYLLGIPAPAQAVGQLLDRALDPVLAPALAPPAHLPSGPLPPLAIH
jgi:predicted AlkP superfamily phosphohydrolase/phosphomutase